MVNEVITAQSCTRLKHNEYLRTLHAIEFVPASLRQLHRLADALAKLAACPAGTLVRKSFREPHQVMCIFHVCAERLLRRLLGWSGHWSPIRSDTNP